MIEFCVFYRNFTHIRRFLLSGHPSLTLFFFFFFFFWVRFRLHCLRLLNEYHKHRSDSNTNTAQEQNSSRQPISAVTLKKYNAEKMESNWRARKECTLNLANMCVLMVTSFEEIHLHFTHCAMHMQQLRVWKILRNHSSL